MSAETTAKLVSAAKFLSIVVKPIKMSPADILRAKKAALALGMRLM